MIGGDMTECEISGVGRGGGGENKNTYNNSAGLF